MRPKGLTSEWMTPDVWKKRRPGGGRNLLRFKMFFCMYFQNHICWGFKEFFFKNASNFKRVFFLLSTFLHNITKISLEGLSSQHLRGFACSGEVHGGEAGIPAAHHGCSSAAGKYRGYISPDIQFQLLYMFQNH